MKLAMKWSLFCPLVTLRDEGRLDKELIYKITKNFMKLLMPSHAVKVKQWKESSPIFQKNNIENQLSSIYADEVYLPSGGSLVLNQTEALVAIDVNSGSSTKYYNIEEKKFELQEFGIWILLLDLDLTVKKPAVRISLGHIPHLIKKMIYMN